MTMMNLQYTIADIRELYLKGKVIWKEHATERMLQRNISWSDVKSCIISGNIIEAYESDKPYPICLILGYCIDKKPLHVVCSTDGSYVYIITVYYPGLNKWESDFKTRKDVQ